QQVRSHRSRRHQDADRRDQRRDQGRLGTDCARHRGLQRSLRIFQAEAPIAGIAAAKWWRLHRKRVRRRQQGEHRAGREQVRDQSPAMVGGSLMTYRIKPLSCDPAKIKGMSERLTVSHYENNYGGAVKRLNLIDEQLAELDYTKAAGFLINGLKREQLIAMNSMILHELFFDGLGDQSEPGPALRDALARDFGSFERWRSEFVAGHKVLGVCSIDPYVGRARGLYANRRRRRCLS